MKTHRPKGSMCIACEAAHRSCDKMAFHLMPVIATDADGTKVVKCTAFRSGTHQGQGIPVSKLRGLAL
jgi:hypothetical protein